MKYVRQSLAINQMHKNIFFSLNAQGIFCWGGGEVIITTNFARKFNRKQICRNQKTNFLFKNEINEQPS